MIPYSNGAPGSMAVSLFHTWPINTNEKPEMFNEIFHQ
jgi:hypothetical protein